MNITAPNMRLHSSKQPISLRTQLNCHLCTCRTLRIYLVTCTAHNLFPFSVFVKRYEGIKDKFFKIPDRERSHSNDRFKERWKLISLQIFEIHRFNGIWLFQSMPDTWQILLRSVKKAWSYILVSARWYGPRNRTTASKVCPWTAAFCAKTCIYLWR